ncbi:polysaccharide deacetylase family protein [Denitrobaculum tricleocarpae]|uniref:Polysaccharide deacetylase n=1 Tax=Denitrobaculum tricleocarpae TaxID=2591009 RepID=A0A545TRE6_9PROT|nr:polysaccharide deacetylase family protein [Denitrobaculum tricleocarpae]TQV79800.1 hypothetical protein FKG95_13955 [Denitrobaculum tricleocarpae]
MTGWDSLARELACWHDAGKVATVWWRDDDAVASTDALERLLILSQKHAAGLGLAVIPERCDAALAERLSDAARGTHARIAVLQHGIAHENTAPAGEKKTELSQAAPLNETMERLKAGQDRLAGLFGQGFLPVLVPPWNRISPEIIAELPARGVSGLSTYKARPQRMAAPGLLQVNTHADLLRWKPDRGFLGETEVLGLLQTHLQDRREDRADADEPTGILTHHLVHDEATWVFLDRLLGWLKRQPAIKFLAPSEAFSHSALTNQNEKHSAAGKGPM